MVPKSSDVNPDALLNPAAARVSTLPERMRLGAGEADSGHMPRRQREMHKVVSTHSDATPLVEHAVIDAKRV